MEANNNDRLAIAIEALTKVLAKDDNPAESDDAPILIDVLNHLTAALVGLNTLKRRDLARITVFVEAKIAKGEWARDCYYEPTSNYTFICKSAQEALDGVKSKVGIK